MFSNVFRLSVVLVVVAALVSTGCRMPLGSRAPEDVQSTSGHCSSCG